MMIMVGYNNLHIVSIYFMPGTIQSAFLVETVEHSCEEGSFVIILKERRLNLLFKSHFAELDFKRKSQKFYFPFSL